MSRATRPRPRGPRRIANGVAGNMALGHLMTRDPAPTRRPPRSRCPSSQHRRPRLSTPSRRVARSTSCSAILGLATPEPVGAIVREAASTRRPSTGRLYDLTASARWAQCGHARRSAPSRSFALQSASSASRLPHHPDHAAVRDVDSRPTDRGHQRRSPRREELHRGTVGDHDGACRPDRLPCSRRPRLPRATNYSASTARSG